MSDPWAPEKKIANSNYQLFIFCENSRPLYMHVKLHAKIHDNKSRLSLSIWPRVKNGVENNNNKFKNINK